MKRHIVLLSVLLFQAATVSVLAQDKPTAVPAEIDMSDFYPLGISTVDEALFARFGLDLPWADEVTFTNESQHEYVDLGLSVKWCTCNVGAATPLDEGYLYKWNYDAKWYVFDGKAFIKSEGNIANLQRGEDWRTPSNDEMIELLSYCTFKWVDNADSCGFKVTSNIEGFTDRSIFIPVLKAKTPVYEIVNTSDGGHYLNSVDSSYQYTGNYMTDFIKDSYNRPGFLRADDGTFMLFKEAQLFLGEYYIRPVRPLDPVTQQNRVLPQVELRETNIVYGEPGDIDISEFEGLEITTVDEGLQW